MTSPPAPLLNPPKQPRSRRTLERIVKAALDILEQEGPSGVTVQAVVGRARSSVGSFYARFGGKDDLLAYLGARVWDEALERWNAAMDARSWAELDLAELVGGLGGLLYDVRRSRVDQLRALDRLTRGGGAYEAFRAHVLADLESLLLERREAIVHPAPELAVRLALRAVLGMLEGDEIAGTGEGEEDARELMVREGRTLLMGYLAGAAPDAGDGEQVEFFDVWG